MVVERKKKYRLVAVVMSTVLLVGNVWTSGNARIYAKTETENKKETEFTEEKALAGEIEFPIVTQGENGTEDLEESEAPEEPPKPDESEAAEEPEKPEEPEEPEEFGESEESGNLGESEEAKEPEKQEESEDAEEIRNPDKSEESEEPQNPDESEAAEESEKTDESGKVEEIGNPDESKEPEESENLDESKEPENPDESEELNKPENLEEQPEEIEFIEVSEAMEERESEIGLEIICETEQESKLETETENETKIETEDFFINSSQGSCYWDESWYVNKDFRFVQVEKDYRIVDGGESVAVYETPDLASKVVGKIPYFGMVYVLKKEKQWFYIESGEVRGFIQQKYLTDKNYADNLIRSIGEESFRLAEINCEKADNAAFTYTRTTVQEVLAPKKYALVLHSGYIREYPEQWARNIGKVTSGNLVYLLEETEDGWFFVESGDSRGFLKKQMILSGTVAEKTIKTIGEGANLAETYILPEENRSCYFTLKSIKTAEIGDGEKIAKFALSFVGKLPYIWGGTSLSSGADCSGFTQSVYAAFGINIPRLAEEQGRAGIEIKSISEAQPGDVVYWADGPHVGIFVGDEQVVQCSGNSSNTADNPGVGVTLCSIDYRPVTSIRRFQIEASWYIGVDKRTDQTPYSQSQMELIWAIVAQEDNGSYTGALAVISSAMNRTESANWRHCGANSLMQLTAPGQYCYSIDNHWRQRLNGNVPEYVKQAVNDCLKNGIRNHSFTSFRSTKGNQTGEDAVQIGGNWFFGS